MMWTYELLPLHLDRDRVQYVVLLALAPAGFGDKDQRRDPLS